MTSEKIVGLILAAGYSSRMGAFKPLLPIGDMTAIERIADTLGKAGVDTIIGVTGFQRELLSPIFAEKGILEAYNPDFSQGMFASVRAGISRALTDAEEAPKGFFLIPVDCPLIPPEVFKQLIKKHEEEPDAFLVPCYRGKKGHPLFIPSCYAEEILAHDGEGGLKAVTNRHEDKLIRLETGMEAVVLDMDTPEGYREILEHYRKQTDGFGEEKEDMKALLQGKRLFLVRHGEIRQHREKIFLGQTDVPLSDLGRVQASEAAEELIRNGISVNRIYASDLSRAAETAEIIRESLQRHRKSHGEIESKIEVTQKNDPVIEEIRETDPEIEVIRDPGMREMSLGEWDGRFISEIREQYPEEYEKRGKHLLTYKFGNDSENYYDLQYRVIKSLKRILERERNEGDSGDIVIVSHMGVINVMISNLFQTKLEDEIKNRLPNGGIRMADYSKKKERLR